MSEEEQKKTKNNEEQGNTENNVLDLGQKSKAQTNPKAKRKPMWYKINSGRGRGGCRLPEPNSNLQKKLFSGATQDHSRTPKTCFTFGPFNVMYCIDPGMALIPNTINLNPRPCWQSF